MNIDNNLDLKNSFIYNLHREYLGYKEVQVNTPVDIVRNYIDDSHVFRCYTDSFTNYTGKISYLQLADMLEYGRLYHVYIPWNLKLGWFYNVSYINFFSDSSKLMFCLKFNYQSVNQTDNLYIGFLKSYAEYRKKFK